MTTTKHAVDPTIGRDSDSLPQLTNLAVLQGQMTNEPTRRDLPAGGVVVQFDISMQVAEGGRVVTVSSPVAWHDPGASASAVLVAGGEFLVVGSVRRRFFRVGGATQSRTEVVAGRVIPLRRRKQVDAALADVIGRLGDAGG